jgi:tRNA-Thr(GGU) m(6)t(6)A37 methyltransferase TsaA
MNEFNVRPIGYIHSEHRVAEQTPIQPVFAQDCEGYIEIFPEFEQGLQDIEGFSHIILLYWLHKADAPKMIVMPFLEDVEHGIFATRTPLRPNAVGLSIVNLIGREGRILQIRGVDILDKTPLLDIKPYSSLFDCFPGSRNGWMDKVDKSTMYRKGRREFTGSDRPGEIP